MLETQGAHAARRASPSWRPGNPGDTEPATCLGMRPVSRWPADNPGHAPRIEGPLRRRTGLTQTISDDAERLRNRRTTEGDAERPRVVPNDRGWCRTTLSGAERRAIRRNDRHKTPDDREVTPNDPGVRRTTERERGAGSSTRSTRPGRRIATDPCRDERRTTSGPGKRDRTSRNNPVSPGNGWL